MANLYYRYGFGKSAELCITAYNYKEQNGKVAIFNGENNEEIVSSVSDEKNVLSTAITDVIDSDIFARGKMYQKNNISAILIDNAHFLTKEQAEQFFLLAKYYDIPVLAYGNRVETPSSLRFMELADRIEPVDGIPNEAKKAALHFYYGAMNCGKTTKLYCRAQYLEGNGKKVKLLRSVFDREKDVIKSRSNLTRKVDILLLKEEELYTKVADCIQKEKVDHLLVDEAQFLTRNQVLDLWRIQREYNIPISCYGLKTDFQTFAFPGSARLLIDADCLEHLKTVCSCKNKKGANFNARLIKDKNGNMQFTRVGEQVCLDGVVSYTSLCDMCYLEKVLGFPYQYPQKVLKQLQKTKTIF